jgi:hypothetical protein
MDFERADYVATQAIESEVVGQPVASRAAAAFPLALVFGGVAAIVGSIGYALVGLTGFMVSIVAIGIAWLIAKAMMTASGGAGGQQYQIAAVVFTYFAVSCGEVLGPVWKLVHRGVPAGAILNPVLLKYVLFGPFLELQDGFNGIIGLIILFVGVRAAWRLAAGSPGFGGGQGGRRMTPFG